MKNKSKKTSKKFQNKQIPTDQLKAIKGGDGKTIDSIIIEDFVNG